MRKITSNELASLRKIFSKGKRVRLIRMDDIQAPPIGSLGTVVGVDDIGSVMVNWDSGSTLSVLYLHDECEIVE